MGQFEPAYVQVEVCIEFGEGTERAEETARRIADEVQAVARRYGLSYYVEDYEARAAS